MSEADKISSNQPRRSGVENHVMKQAERVSTSKISNPSQVAAANLSNFRMQELPSLEAFTALRKVFASGCGMESVCSQTLPSLEDVDFSYNAIVCVPEVKAPLRSLDLSHNKIENFGDCEEYPRLEQLCISFNPLKQLGIFRCASLRILRISSCGIDNLGFLTELERLNVLEAKQNRLAATDVLMDLPEGISELDIASNPVVTHHRCFEACCYRLEGLKRYNGKECTQTQVRFAANKFLQSTVK